MSNMTADTIEINEDWRILVEYDTDAQCPRGDWATLTGFIRTDEVHNGLIDVPAVHSPEAPIAWANERYPWWSRSYTQAGFVARWAKVFYGLAAVYDDEHGGYWFCNLSSGDEGFPWNWPDLVIGTPEHYAKQLEVIEQDRATYGTWAAGEVYGVILEQRKHYAKYEVELTKEGFEVSTAEAPRVTHEWLPKDSLWSCYLDDEYTAERVVLEQFELPDDIEQLLRERITK